MHTKDEPVMDSQPSLPFLASRTQTSTVTVTPLPPQALTHRHDFARFVREDADPWYCIHLGRLNQKWTDWNKEYFAGRLVVPPYILLNEPAQSRSYGEYSNVSGFGGQSQIRLRPSLLTGTHPHVRPEPEFAEGRFLFVADVLLHEMIHQYHHEVTGKVEAYMRATGQLSATAVTRSGKGSGSRRSVWQESRISSPAFPPVRSGLTTSD